jgi:hypothetical protein
LTNPLLALGKALDKSNQPVKASSHIRGAGLGEDTERRGKRQHRRILRVDGEADRAVIAALIVCWMNPTQASSLPRPARLAIY